jgi:hypothetical protein
LPGGRKAGAKAARNEAPAPVKAAAAANAPAAAKAPAAVSTASAAGPWKSGDVLASADSPEVTGHAFGIKATVDSGPTAEGVILAQGGKAQGYALHAEGGKPAFSVRSAGKLSTVTATQALTAGVHELRADLAADGTVVFQIDGKPAGGGKVEGLLAKKPGEGLTVGNDGQVAVGEYSGPHAFSGKVTGATVTIH